MPYSGRTVWVGITMPGHGGSVDAPGRVRRWNNNER